MTYNQRTSRQRSNLIALPRIDNLVNEFFNTAVGDVIKKSEKKHFTNPATNVIEHDDRYVLTIALPGYAKEDLAITVDDQILKVVEKSLDEEKATKKEASVSKFRLREFNYSGFNKSYKLPDEAAAQKISATVDLGLLTIEIPKKEEAIPQPPREINIK